MTGVRQPFRWSGREVLKVSPKRKLMTLFSSIYGIPRPITRQQSSAVSGSRKAFHKYENCMTWQIQVLGKKETHDELHV